MVSVEYANADSTLGSILQHFLLNLNEVTYAGYEVNEDSNMLILHVETIPGINPNDMIKLAARYAKECIESMKL